MRTRYVSMSLKSEGKLNTALHVDEEKAQDTNSRTFSLYVSYAF